jgi:ribosomal protein S18 acetylase RimI-like enzyme
VPSDAKVADASARDDDVVTVSLEAMTAQEIAVWLPVSSARYVAERIEAGESPDHADRVVASQRRAMFRDGVPNVGQFLFNVREGDRTVGGAWIGVAPTGEPGAYYLYEIEIHELQRGRGLGRATMVALNEWARAQGATKISLNVFGPNLRARALYDSLGYEVVATSMSLEL